MPHAGLHHHAKPAAEGDASTEGAPGLPATAAPTAPCAIRSTCLTAATEAGHESDSSEEELEPSEAAREWLDLNVEAVQVGCHRENVTVAKGEWPDDSHQGQGLPQSCCRINFAGLHAGHTTAALARPMHRPRVMTKPAAHT